MCACTYDDGIRIRYHVGIQLKNYLGCHRLLYEYRYKDVKYFLCLPAIIQYVGIDNNTRYDLKSINLPRLYIHTFSFQPIHLAIILYLLHQ